MVLHTNLGRAPLADEALAAMHAVAAGYTNLEFDLPSGRRGSRTDHCKALLAELTGAEDALVVNNAAGALVLVLNQVAGQREVIISRGELIEIGGSFRIPEILEKSGAILREVGTTNRTHLDDYAGAMGPGTGAILTVHQSNFEQRGFVTAVDVDRHGFYCASTRGRRQECEEENRNQCLAHDPLDAAKRSRRDSFHGNSPGLGIARPSARVTKPRSAASGTAKNLRAGLCL